MILNDSKYATHRENYNPMMQVHEGSQALLTHTRKLTEEERSETKGEWAYIVLKTQSSLRVNS